jgi:phosphoribosylanthranilate isomerase
VKIKICGITRLADALAAAECGADAIGFIFVQSSPRYIPPARAAGIVRALPASVLPVGVFVDASRSTIAEAVTAVGIRALQLHGDEPPESTIGFGLPVFKAHRVSPDFAIETLGRYAVAAHLLDAYVEGIRGGTGRQFNWEVAVQATREYRIILSGGLTPENIDGAIRHVRPQAVDVSSGVEQQPGLKDHVKLRRFIEAARNAFERESIS